MSDFHNQTTQRSRKRRKCQCTGAIIEPGDEYVRFSGTNDGDFYNVVVHSVVAPIYNYHCDLCYETQDEGLPFDDLMESLIYMHVTPRGMEECRTVAALPGVPQWFVDKVNGLKETE